MTCVVFYSLHTKTPDRVTRQSITMIEKEGYLFKMGAVVKSWQKRWFVLKDNQLQYPHILINKSGDT
jgi:hypothetical protein